MRKVFVTVAMMVSSLMTYGQVEAGAKNTITTSKITTEESSVVPSSNAESASTTSRNPESNREPDVQASGIPSQEIMITSEGLLGVGTATPEAKLDVNGYVKLGSADAVADLALTPGMMRFNTVLGVFEGYVADADDETDGFQPGWVRLN